MEESEKRRERLKAMRTQAAQAGDYNDIKTSTLSHGLSNPLIETPATLSEEMESCATPRFDYYTHPMSAFSGNKMRGKVSHQISQDYFTPPRPRNPEMTPPPAHQGLTNHFPDQRMFQAQEFHHSSGLYGSPVGMAGPLGLQQVATPGVWNGSGSYCFPSNSSRGDNFPSPGSGQGGLGGSPSSNSGQGRGHWLNNSPGLGFGRGGSPGLGLGCIGSPGPNSGRGRGRWLGNSMSPGSGRSHGRGFGSRDRVSAEIRPDLYYHKSMVEDPWKFLKPVIWTGENFPAKSLNTPDSLKSWLPKSVSMKKARVSEVSKESSSEPSLAEYLAASFNEAVNNQAVNDAPNL